MSLFFDVLSAVNNPNQQASVDQIGSLVNSVQQISQQTGIDPSTTQTVLSSLGGFIRPALQQQAAGGQNQLTDMIGQLAGGGTNPLGGLVGQAMGGSALQSLFPPQMQQQAAQSIAQKTGLSPALLESLIPSLIPVVLNFLNMGSSKPGVSGGGNPLLTAFLDGDRDGDTDLGDMMKFATRFINPAQ